MFNAAGEKGFLLAAALTTVLGVGSPNGVISQGSPRRNQLGFVYQPYNHRYRAAELPETVTVDRQEPRVTGIHPRAIRRGAVGLRVFPPPGKRSMGTLRVQRSPWPGAALARIPAFFRYRIKLGPGYGTPGPSLFSGEQVARSRHAPSEEQPPQHSPKRL